MIIRLKINGENIYERHSNEIKNFEIEFDDLN